MRKYEFAGETITANGVTLHQIRALIDIPLHGVRVGDVGGWIEGERNLSHLGDAWVGDNARVEGDARVFGNAHIYGYARVNGCAWIRGNALVFGNAHIYGYALVSGHAQISGYVRVCGDVRVCGNARIDGNALINSNRDFISIGPIGSRGDFITFHKNVNGIICVKCGCFSGTMDEFLTAVQETHGDNEFGQEYRIAAELAKAHILGED